LRINKVVGIEAFATFFLGGIFDKYVNDGVQDFKRFIGIRGNISDAEIIFFGFHLYATAQLADNAVALLRGHIIGNQARLFTHGFHNAAGVDDLACLFRAVNCGNLGTTLRSGPIMLVVSTIIKALVLYCLGHTIPTPNIKKLTPIKNITNQSLKRISSAFSASSKSLI